MRVVAIKWLVSIWTCAVEFTIIWWQHNAGRGGQNFYRISFFQLVDDIFSAMYFYCDLIENLIYTLSEYSYSHECTVAIVTKWVKVNDIMI